MEQQGLVFHAQTGFQTWGELVVNANTLILMHSFLPVMYAKAKDEVSSDSLLSKLGTQDLDVVSRMRWFGHVEVSTGWIAKARK